MHDSQSGRDDGRFLGSVFVLLLRSWAATVEVFLHRAPTGRRWPGVFGLGGAALLFFFGALFPRDDIRPLLVHLAVFLLACLWTRSLTAWRTRRGAGREYGWYTGYPRIMRLVPWIGELWVKRFLEPLVVFTAGVFTLPWSEPLGAYWLGAALSLFLTVNSAELEERARAQEMLDQVHLQRRLAERFRELEGNPF